MLAERLREILIVSLRSDLRVQGSWVGDIIPVQAAGGRFQVRRRIAVGDAQRMQIGNDLPRALKGKRPIELQSIGRHGYSSRRCSHEITCDEWSAGCWESDT